MLASYNAFKVQFLSFLLILAFVSCQQNSSLPQLKIVENKTDLGIDSLDVNIRLLMTKHNVPGVNVAFIKNGQLGETRNYGTLQKGRTERVNDETMFSVGSISKVVNAILTLKLVKAGQLDLDENINNYLKDWKVEQNQFSKDNPVTLRQLLSHTAGFSVHGFKDFYPGEKLPTTLEVITGTGSAKNEAVELISIPGNKYKYSGGGITIIQKIIEDVTGLTYHEAASQLLIKPLGLKRMTFENPLPIHYGNIAKAHDGNGNPVALPRGYQAMPEKAASGLWTTVNDLANLLSQLVAVGKNESSALLTSQLVQDMITKEKNSDFGLGPHISFYNDYKIVAHNGANDSYKATFSIFWKEGIGYVVFTNGSNGTALINDLRSDLESYLDLKKQ